MAKIIDLRGYSCPIPLLKTKDALLNETRLTVVVDEPPAKENIIKFAKAQNCHVECTSENGEFTINIQKNEQ